jgi:hypothetical protein
MTTTGELRVIIEELHLIDVGDAASYLGEEALRTDEVSLSDPQQEGSSDAQTRSYGSYPVSSNEDSSFH